MDRELGQALSHVLWTGGATDTGKTTISEVFAVRYGFQVYHYDPHDQSQMEHLAQSFPHYRVFLEASLDERSVPLSE